MTTKPTFNTRFNPPSHPGLSTPLSERRTKSEFKDECDINKIMAKYKATGILPESARAAAAQYGDFSQVPGFQEMQDKLNAAREVFAALPAAVRKQFDNDPGEFIDASTTPEGRDLLIKLGLGKPSETQSQPPGKTSASPAVQAEPAGTEPAAAPSKGAPKAKSSGTSE